MSFIIDIRQRFWHETCSDITETVKQMSIFGEQMFWSQLLTKHDSMFNLLITLLFSKLLIEIELD